MRKKEKASRERERNFSLEREKEYGPVTSEGNQRRKRDESIRQVSNFTQCGN